MTAALGKTVKIFGNRFCIKRCKSGASLPLSLSMQAKAKSVSALVEGEALSFSPFNQAQDHTPPRLPCPFLLGLTCVTGVIVLICS